MVSKTPFDFDIRVSSEKKRKKSERQRGTAESTFSQHRCDYPQCGNSAGFRAPKSPEQLDDFFWFCKEHIREYNLKWNFFNGSSDDDFQKFLENDRVWGRATRPFSRKDDGRAWERLGIADPMGFLGEKGLHSPSKTPPLSGATRKIPAVERKAIEVLTCHDSMTKTEIRRTYKALVKELHPDLNGGDRSDEERLQEVLWAWEQLKDSRYFVD